MIKGNDGRVPTQDSPDEGKGLSGPRAAPTPGTAAVQVAILLVPALWLFRDDLVAIFSAATRDAEGAHILAIPLLIGILIWRRRRLLVESLAPGSAWAIPLLVLSVLVAAASSWPYNFGLPRRLALIPILAAILLAVGGRRLCFRCLPMLLLVLIMIPLGARLYATAMRIPDQITLRGFMGTMEMLPRVIALELRGPDLHYTATSGRGTILLGEPHRWSSLMLSYLTLAVFVTFVRARPPWQIACMAVAALPIAFVCNFARLMTWGVVNVYGGVEPTSHLPRLAAIVVSVPLAYLLAALTMAVLARVVVRA
jgi:hypothetical protein